MIEGEEVDLIYRWVNPKAGLAKQRRILRSNPVVGHGEMNNIQRYRDNSELRYSLRSVAIHTPWVRAIHVIGEGRPPRWLRCTFPIVWTDCNSLLRRHGQVPQLNSETQKLYFSKIPGLAERFICLDDDWFFGNAITKEHFFADDGRPMQPPWMAHAPIPWTRTLYDLAIDLLPADYLGKVKTARTVREDPYPEMHSVLLGKGLVIPSPGDPGHMWLNDYGVHRYKQILEQIIEWRPKTFCINDDWSSDASEYREQLSFLISFFEVMYPTAAKWERSEPRGPRSWLNALFARILRGQTKTL